MHRTYRNRKRPDKSIDAKKQINSNFCRFLRILSFISEESVVRYRKSVKLISTLPYKKQKRDEPVCI
jgi:hypothetical protein